MHVADKVDEELQAVGLGEMRPVGSAVFFNWIVKFRTIQVVNV